MLLEYMQFRVDVHSKFLPFLTQQHREGLSLKKKKKKEREYTIVSIMASKQDSAVLATTPKSDYVFTRDFLDNNR